MFVSLLFALLASAALAIGAARREPAADRVVLKSGRELVGKLIADADHVVVFADETRGELRLPRHLLRTVVRGDAPQDAFAPLWLDPPAGELPRSWTRHEPPRAGRPGALSTGIGRFFHEPSRTTLFLVGAIHIGDPAYYQRLQDVLDSCDAVLFEGVGGDADAAAPSAEDIARFDALFQLQLKLNALLGLQFQKDGLDYDRSWWRNADVGMVELKDQLDARGAALPTDSPLVRALLQMVLGGLDASQIDRDPRMRLLVKRQVAMALATADQLLATQMQALNEVLIDWRNDAALCVLDDELARGAKGRWIALFYGAAHLPDFARKLAERGFEYQAAAWLEAWRID